MGLRSFLGNLISGRSPFQEKFERIEQKVFPLSVEEARAEFERFLTDADKYSVDATPPNAADLQIIEMLPASARELFRRFARIEERCGDTRLLREAIGPSAIYPGMTRIGRSTEEWELVVRPPDERVYVASGLPRDIEPGEAYPSIYHFLLYQALLIYAADPWVV